LIDEIIVDKNQTELLKSLGLSTSKTTIGLMPGSRAKEVERHLPCILCPNVIPAEAGIQNTSH
jgi:lipid A disaccharide synthetase